MRQWMKGVFAALGLEVRRIDRRRNEYIGRSAWDYQESYVLPLYKDGEIVIDIGCGGAPAPIASVLTDYFPDHSIHRARPLVEDRPLVVCSVDRMPFRDKCFDLSLCAHVLEHVPDPERAALEIARISKRGYLETPAYGKDILVGTGHQHVWQVVCSDTTFHFFPYTERQHAAHRDSPMMTIWCQEGFHEWQSFFWSRQDLFNAIQVWTDTPRIEVHALIDGVSDQPTWSPIPAIRLPSIPPLLTEREVGLLESFLISPDKSEPMRYDGSSFVNASSTIHYPVRGKRVYFELGDV